MNIYKYPERNEWKKLCQRPQLQTAFLDSVIQNILSQVQKCGDQALKEFTSRFDRVNLSELTVCSNEISESEKKVSNELKIAISRAAENIHAFHALQKWEPEKIETMPGVVCWRKAIPIEKVGIYIPGGSAPLFSTVLMLGIPAKLAGCRQIVLCSPPDINGDIHPAILYAASIVGIEKIFKVGGAQAIAAMAYGTESIPEVYKIFGPGNQYVTKAKQLVSMEGTAIDMPAGPSEVLVLADEWADASFVAADLLSQAEHGPDSQVILVTDSEPLAAKVMEEVNRQIFRLPRKEIAAEALKNSSVLILNKTDAIAFSNAYAPEHLIINTTDADILAEQIINAGSVFIGPHSPEAVGDYASGTNHTLPTNGYAKSYGGVALDSFMKYTTFQKLSAAGLRTIALIVEQMAQAEQLQAHAEAVSVRRRNQKICNQ
ncbi:MAG: histidinol dehydrogenase [Bacteroidetes bacterium]|nr:histidinol dehydrogenase [Bacteroidota bacterium]MBS1539713.1 histidinol dehydrogenase [Bacteroidota bacterium]